MKSDPWATQLGNPLRRLSLILLAFLMVTACGSPLVAETFRLETATIADINAAFEAGALTSEGLVQLYLNRIEAYDQKGPKLNSIITLSPKALERARELDSERRRSGPRSILHGIPIAVKDLFDTHDLPTSGGFLPMAESQPWRDAFGRNPPEVGRSGGSACQECPFFCQLLAVSCQSRQGALIDSFLWEGICYCPTRRWSFFSVATPFGGVIFYEKRSLGDTTGKPLATAFPYPAGLSDGD